MGERLIKPYEISVWEDFLTQDGFIEEKKLAVIGSDTMTGYNKIYDPVFHKKANGEKTLTFSLKYKYLDPYSGAEDAINPFASLLINERKVKLKYDGQWYEFIVKDHTESSDENTWEYTCNDASVLELSKNGYNITFDSELNNNQGTARELAQKTIKNTDWQLGDVDLLRQLVDEPIYNGTISGSFSALNTDTNEEEICSGNVYVFYTYVKNKDGKFVQFIKQADSYTIDDHNVITATNYRILRDNIVVTDTEIKSGDITLITLGEIETRYQANRLVYNQLTTYDPVIERTVDRFKANDREIYRYTDYVYTTSNVVMNYITNGENFNVLEDGTLQGWNPYVDVEEGQTVNKLELLTRPELGTGKPLADLSNLSQIEGFLKVQFNNVLTANYENAVYNSGIENNASTIESISVGDRFVFRWRAGQRADDLEEEDSDLKKLKPAPSLRLLVAKYMQDAPQRFGYYYKHIDPENIIMQFEGTPVELNNYIRGGTLEPRDDDPTKFNYVIDDVIQAPSTKYIYVNGDDDKEYVWNGETGNFAEKNDSNYLPYYYLVTDAKKGISNSTLSDVTEKIGLFIYTNEITIQEEEPLPYYIQDIQFTRFIPDGADATGQTPILIGNIPVANSKSTEYYYLKPEDGTAAEDVVKYTSIEELAAALEVETSDIVPLYNENSEKNLSISASQSNCFDILQTIAETFECWIDLVIEHDDNGYVTYTDGKPNKFVYLREYAGKDNWAGFKYGINLQSIERNINSEEFVTKLIVDQSQSDYVDEGFVSISNAPSNTSGESYILNFDYYYNQGLLNRAEVEDERLKFIEEVAQKNQTLKELEQQRRDLESSMTALGSKRNVYAELIDSAQDTQSTALGEFYNLTGKTYEEYKAEHETLVEDDQLTEEDTILDILGDLYVSSAAINNYSGLLTNIDQEYWEVRKKLRGSENYKVKVWTGTDENQERHVFVELNDYLIGFSFTIGSITETSTVSKKYFDIITNATEITFTPPQGYSMEQTSYTIVDSQDVTFKITSDATIEGVEDKIEEAQKDKDDLTNAFNKKYIRFIQEGTWNSTDYIDSELYYLDALQVSNTSAQPAVSYTINVVEISELEGFEWYDFDAGDKSYIEDTEFFGWANVNGVLTPAREEVIVSEVEWHLEEPDKDVITVQNYKTRFEDFFQRINATVQTVQYNEATYAKISTLLDANGTINQDVLLQSLNNIGGKEYTLTSDGSVRILNDVILVQNLTNPANRVIINSEGIRVSSDGGNTWTTAIDGQGINIGAVYTGTLNTNEVIIGNKDNPSFRWDKAGISAFKSTNEDTYDLQTYVRYDQYGLYGIKDGGAFKAANLQEVLDKAHFAVTWDGFFIKNSYDDGGRVSITSDNDFQVIDGADTERIKIGSLDIDSQTNERIYGISISDKNGNSVLNTNNDGDITITGTINAQAGVFDGLVRVGNSSPYIAIDGENAVIKSSNYVDDPSASATYGWMINKDGDAVFNNITARGAIRTAVFEYAEIQAVGGVFIFRPSSTIRSAAVSGNNLVLTVEKPLLFKVGQWCKISNYISDGEATNPDVTNILLTNGLTHVYQITDVTEGNITLSGAKALLDAIDKDANVLIGGALIDMGRKSNDSGYDDGIHNYGIGVNSSDNTVNLPARAISLFETVIDETKEPKVSYKYRGILGTLPTISAGVDSNIYQHMQGTQGIYTDNMYIGDNNQYLAFYTDSNDNKHLKINSSEIVYDIIDGQEVTWEEHIDEEVDNATPIMVEISSNIGNMILKTDTVVTLTCTVKKGNTDITSQVSTFTWTKLDRSGNIDPDWSSPTSGNQITIAASDVHAKAIFICEVTL